MYLKVSLFFTFKNSTMSAKAKAIFLIIVLIATYSGRVSPHHVELLWLIWFICLFIPSPPEQKKSIRDEKFGDVIDDLFNRKH